MGSCKWVCASFYLTFSSLDVGLTNVSNILSRALLWTRCPKALTWLRRSGRLWTRTATRTATRTCGRRAWRRRTTRRSGDHLLIISNCFKKKRELFVRSLWEQKTNNLYTFLHLVEAWPRANFTLLHSFSSKTFPARSYCFSSICFDSVSEICSQCRPVLYLLNRRYSFFGLEFVSSCQELRWRQSELKLTIAYKRLKQKKILLQKPLRSSSEGVSPYRLYKASICFLCWSIWIFKTLRVPFKRFIRWSHWVFQGTFEAILLFLFLFLKKNVFSLLQKVLVKS